MMGKNKKIDIREIFLGLQKQMSSKLSLNKKILTHPVAKGDASELEWVDMLNSYLPRRYQVDKAFVMDHEGAVSEQIDIVIFDRHFSPFLLRQNGANYVPAESVYAVIEVNQKMNSESIRYAANKASSVRRLKRTSAQIVHAEGKVDQPKKPFDILAGILTLDGTCTASLQKEIIKLKGKKRLNFGCSLESRAFVLNYNEDAEIEISRPEDSLIFFFLKLLSSLQSLGTVPAMEIDQYADKMR